MPAVIIYNIQNVYTFAALQDDTRTYGRLTLMFIIFLSHHIIVGNIYIIYLSIGTRKSKIYRDSIYLLKSYIHIYIYIGKCGD